MGPTSDRHQDAVDLARGTGVNLLGNIGKFTRPLAFVFAGRVLGAEAVGLFVLAWSVVDFLSKLAIFGLDVSIVKFISKRRLEETPGQVHLVMAQAFSISVVTSLTVAIAIVVASPWIAERIFDMPALATPLRVLAIGVPFLATNWIMLGATKALKIMRFDIYVRHIIEPFAFLSGVVLSSIFWPDGKGIALAQAAALIVGALASVVCFSRHYSIRQCIGGMSLSAFRSDLSKISLPVSMYNLLNVFSAHLDVLLLGHFLPAGRVGIYGMAKEVTIAIKKFRQACDPIFAPLVSDQLHGQEIGRLRETLSMAARWTLSLGLPFLGVLLFASETILSLYGTEFVAGAAPAITLAGANLINSVFGYSELILLMAGLPYLNLLNTVGFVVLTGLGGIFLIPIYDILGPPLAMLLAVAAINLVRLFQVKHFVGVHPFHRALAKPLASFACGAMAAFAVGIWLNPHQVVSAGLFLLVYLLVRLVLKLEPEERKLVQRLLRRLKPETAA